ncbi:MAG: hypothetical protein SGI92_14190 [Bryobacteraceae bacterium]|nr:hypothetical protein [Bryobacteraceae bacterium]
MLRRLSLLVRRIAGKSVAARLLLVPGIVPLRGFVRDGASAARLEKEFCPRWYSLRYPDVKAGGLDPLIHYLAYGQSEGRQPSPWVPPGHDLVQTAENPATPPVRITALFLRYGSERYPGALARFRSLLSIRFSEAQIWTVLVDNALPPDYCEYLTDEGVTAIGGDNSSWEFSGWQKALEWSEAVGGPPDWILFATDAFDQLYIEFLQHFSTGLLQRLVTYPVALGHLDSYNEAVTAFGRTAQHWIRTSFFVVRAEDARKLGHLHTVTAPAEIFAGNPQAPFLAHSPVDHKLQGYITGWLTGPGTGQGVAWHSRFDLNPETLPYFEAKAIAILNEFSLSARLAELGIRLLDVTWARSAGSDLPNKLDTHWRAQIDGRFQPGHGETA